MSYTFFYYYLFYLIVENRIFQLVITTWWETGISLNFIFSILTSHGYIQEMTSHGGKEVYCLISFFTWKMNSKLNKT